MNIVILVGTTNITLSPYVFNSREQDFLLLPSKKVADFAYIVLLPFIVFFSVI